MYRRAFSLAALLLALVWCSNAALAQNITGNISGTVTDANGAAIPGATVGAWSRALG